MWVSAGLRGELEARLQRRWVLMELQSCAQEFAPFIGRHLSFCFPEKDPKV